MQMDLARRLCLNSYSPAYLFGAFPIFLRFEHHNFVLNSRVNDYNDGFQQQCDSGANNQRCELESRDDV